MQKNILRICLLTLTLLLTGVNADAQLLKKLAKGLEKVNKGLEKVEEVLQIDNKGNSKETGKQSQMSENNSQSPTSAGQTPVNESGWKTVESTYITPYFTAETKLMVTDASAHEISDVHDDVFVIKHGVVCEFWKVTGEKLFNADWKSASGTSSDFPIFSGGVAVARRVQPNANGKTPICLLYLDGRVKELDPSWETVSQFMDGVALVTAKINYKEQVFYIDVAGNKLYPNLKVDRANVNPMRPLRDGMRAYYGPGANPSDGDKWGFIDAKGDVKISPKYKEVSDFSNGYAWVWTSDYKTGTSYKELIDVTGRVIFKTEYGADASDVVDGVFCIEKNDRNVYYDISGKELASYRSCCGFYDGYAFIAKGHEHADVIDRNFNIVRRMPYDYCNATDVDYNMPNFKPFGLATVNTGSTVIDPKGNIVLESYDNYNGTYVRGFKQFSESGYMKATEVLINRNQCVAFVKPTGEIAWLFSDTRLLGEESPLPVPTPPIPTPPVPTPPFPPIPVEPDQPAIGPKIVENVSFTVKAVAAPSEGGSVSVSPTGKFGYGEYATITASPNENWAVRSIETDVEGLTAPRAGKPFAVIADQTVIVNFVEKEEEEAPDNFGSYLGQVTLADEWVIPVYAEINQKGDEENPYGTNNYGFVTLMFDPNKRYVGGDSGKNFAINFFAVPLKIVGIQKDDTDQSKQWLVVEGGSIATHDLKISTASDPLFGMVVTGMIAFDGFSSVNTQPRRYRIEMLDRDPETGEFRFGNMQTYSVKAGGWVWGDDPSLEETTTGFFSSHTDHGYPSDTFFGAQMKRAEKRNDICWYPPENWSSDKSAYQQLIETMGAAYRSSKSDYEQLFDK